MADAALPLVAPAIEAACKALLTGESQVITTRELRALVTQLDAVLRSERADQQRATEAMLALRKVIDRAVSTCPLQFLKDPLCRALSRTHEALRNFAPTTPRDLPRTKPPSHLRPD